MARRDLYGNMGFIQPQMKKLWLDLLVRTLKMTDDL